MKQQRQQLASFARLQECLPDDLGEQQLMVPVARL